MAELKTLNTRIKLRIDTLENWNNSSAKLLEGELAFATVAASAGTGLSEPVVMVKIGTSEEKTFSELPWAFHAKASDVLTACKTEDGLRAFVNGVIADAGIATDEALSTLAGRVTTAEGEIDTLQADLNTETTGLKARMTTAEGAIDALEGLVGEKTVAIQISEAIAALKLDETYDAKGDAAQALTDAKGYADGLNTAMNTRVEALEAIDHDHANKAELDLIATGDKAKWDAMEQNAKDYADDLDEAMDGRVAALEAKFGDGEGNVTAQIAAAVDAEKAEREAADTALDTRVKAIEDDYLKAADKTALQEQITSNDGEIAALQGLVGDTAVATQISTAVAAEAEIARAAEKANADAIEVLNGNAETEGSVDYKIAQKFSTLVENPDEAMNSIQELVDWTTEHAADALEMSNQVTANKNAIATLNGDASTAGSVDKKIADAIAAENLSQYATDTELSGVDTRLQAVEAAVGESGSVAGDIADALTEAKGYTDAEVKELAEGAVATNASAISALEDLVGDKKVSEQISAVTDPIDERVQALEAIDHEHANKTVLDGITADQVTAWDAAVQTVSVAADSGLTATKTGTDVAIAIDDSLVWVFDCGDSSNV